MTRRSEVASVALLAALCAFAGARALSQQSSAADRQARFLERSRDFEARGLAEPFRGVTTDGKLVSGLFPIRHTGVSTEPVRKAAAAFLAALTPDERSRTTFAVDDPEWRKWMNQHFYVRQGVSFKEMTEAQREAAFGLLRAALSAKGLKLSRDIMRLNHTLGELNQDDFEQYGEWLYHITVMGEPSPTEPWGFQVDGHHLIINYFVLGDQVVMSPAFWGSEPVTAKSGKYAGTSILQVERNQGLALLRALTADQRAKAILAVSKTGNDNVGEAFKDNVVLAYAGVRAAELDAAQKQQLLELASRVRGQPARRPGARADERRPPPPRRHVLRVDRRQRAGQRLLLPRPQPGDPDRVRPPAPGEPAAPRQGPDGSPASSTSTRSSARPTATTTGRTCSASTTRRTRTDPGPRGCGFAPRSA